jgi:hypothetical protein
MTLFEENKPIKKKRGRKPKNVLKSENEKVKGPPKKRGRKPKNAVKSENVKVKGPPKKRGRKPKGGKIVKTLTDVDKNQIIKKTNIILHLKCSSSDIDLNESKIMKFKPEFLNIQNKISNIKFNELKNQNESTDKQDVWDKLATLKKRLHFNNVFEKRSNCFWCTCSFDNPPIYIPKQERNGMIEVYGCFCSPECAVAYLKRESIDTSTLWERYSLLNNVYSNIFNYEHNIKPAPNPYYLLDKFYGNLSINEYRKLLNNQQLLLVVDKPLTKVLPELFEENNDMPTIYSNLLTDKTNKKNLRLHRKVPKNSKKNILNSKFNITS